MSPPTIDPKELEMLHSKTISVGHQLLSAPQAKSKRSTFAGFRRMTIELGFDASKVPSLPKFTKGKTVDPEELAKLAINSLQNAKSAIIEEEKAYSEQSKSKSNKNSESNTSNKSSASRREMLDPMIWKIFQ